jgi:hypothetical protein
MATTNNEKNTTTIDLPDLDTTNTNHHINKYIENQVNKVLNIDQNTTSLDDIMANAVPIWNVLGLTEEEYLKKFFDYKPQDIS